MENCSCVPDIPPHLRYPEIKPTDRELPCLKHLVGSLIFQATRVGTINKKTFRFQNESKGSQTYVTQRDPNINPIYHAFDFKLTKTAVASGDYLECTITYSPQVPHQKNVDYLQILDKDYKLYEVYLEGHCIGPCVNLSIKTLYFHDTKYNKALMNTFEVKNMSKVPTTFQFDVNEGDDDQEVFKIDKIRGNLQPFQHTYITVRFAVKQEGLFCRNLVCMLMHHEPIMLELIGVQKPNLDLKVHDVTLRRYPQTKDEVYGFGGYMYDSLKATIHKPPFSLSVNYLDFGRAEFQKDADNSHSLVTSLTNHRNEKLEVIWTNDSKQIFSITPEEVVLPPKESVMYEVQLRAELPDQLYSKLLTADVYWTNSHRQAFQELTSLEIIDVPLNLSLKVLGHSFPENKVWLPVVEIKPDVVIMPPCMPTRPSYTTLMLKSSGHLPTSFKFIPPHRSNFLLKPMEGIIHDFQIVVVQLQPDSSNKKAYIERWGVELNGRTEDCLPFYLKGYSEFASIMVGAKNVVTFRPVQPGCQDILNVMVRNTSTHFLKYSFIVDKNSQISIDSPKGELASNETTYLQWYSTGHLKAPEMSTVKCEIRSVQNTKLITGAPLYTCVTVYSKCAYSELCATPNSFDFGLTKWGTKHSTTFHLFNFGESALHFELIRTDPECLEDLVLVPTTGTVNPGEKLKIAIDIKTSRTGHNEVKLAYRVRLNKTSNVVINDRKEYDIFSMYYNCLYPTIQIKDICSNNFGFLFSKITLWEIFNIDEINKALNTICHDETKSVDMFLPDYEIGEGDFSASLLIRNETLFPAEIKVKRKKLCDCKLVSKAKGISLREVTYDCIHRDMCTFTLSDECIEPNVTQKLRLDVKYLEHGLTKMMYILQLSENRNINICISINGLPHEATMASKYAHHYEFQLKSVFIGEKQPPAQAFPLYNNSAFIIHYKINTTPLERLNFDYGFEIFKCLNPSGTILPFTSYNIIFSFVPIEVRKYSVIEDVTKFKKIRYQVVLRQRVAVPLIMGENKLSLQLRGDGVAVFDPRLYKISHTLPCSSKANFMENLVELSVDHLIVEPFLVWSKTERMIFIRNETSDRIIGYSWQSCTVEGIVHVEVVYGKGVLQPKECHAIIIHINSFDQPCRLRLHMACKLLDHTQHINHKESAAAYERKQRELAGQFTITEKGIFHPKNDVVVLPKAENFFLTLAISLNIVSVADRDLWLSKEEQLQQSPQYSVHANTSNIFEEYFPPLMPKGSRLHMSVMSQSGDFGNPRVQQRCCKITCGKNEVKLYKSTLECLIGDAVLSNLFCKLVHATNNSFQPYYTQFKMDDAPTSCLSKDSVFRKDQEDLEKRMELVQDYLNKPQTPLVAGIFNELIADSIHEIFKLGPQIKNRPPKSYTYHSAKSKFFSMQCKCDCGET